MANVTVAGASYVDVPAVELPTTGGGTSTFYEADFKTVTQTLTNITSSADDTRVENGSSFFTELTPSDGYYIFSITVTMGGVDITDQVFKPGLGAKVITANGSYSAASDSLSGYSAVSVNVSGGGSPNLQSKTKTYTPTTSTQTETVSADTGYDGLSSVGITVNPIPSQYIVPSGTKNITANGTGIDVAAYASVDVAVPTGGGKTIYSGTFTPATKTLSQAVTVGSDAISFVACFALASPWTSTGRSFGAGLYDVATSRHPVVASNSAGSAASGSVSGGFSISQSGTTLTLTTQNATGSGYFVAGIEYKWVAW